MTRTALLALSRAELVTLAEDADADLARLDRPAITLPPHALPRWLLVERVLLAARVRAAMRAAA